MYVKLNNGQVEKFPYSIGLLRKDNPHTSFPKIINEQLLASYEIFPVVEGDIPECNIHQYTRRNDLPVLKEGTWVLEHSVHDMFETSTDEDGVTITKEQKEAIHQQQLNTIAATNNRSERDRRIAETDWWALSDVTMTEEQAVYRQALRDITTHANWPNLQDADWPVKP